MNNSLCIRQFQGRSLETNRYNDTEHIRQVPCLDAVGSDQMHNSTTQPLDGVTKIKKTLSLRNTTFLLVILNSLFGCVCQPMIYEYDDDDD